MYPHTYTHAVRARGKPSQEALKNILALEQSMPKVYKKIQAAESAPPPNKSQKGGYQASSSNLNTTSAPAEPASSGTSRFGSCLTKHAFLLLLGFAQANHLICQAFYRLVCLAHYSSFSLYKMF